MVMVIISRLTCSGVIPSWSLYVALNFPVANNVWTGPISPSLASCMISSWSGGLSSGGIILSRGFPPDTLGGTALAFPFAKADVMGAAPCGDSEDADGVVILCSVRWTMQPPRLPHSGAYFECIRPWTKTKCSRHDYLLLTSVRHSSENK